MANKVKVGIINVTYREFMVGFISQVSVKAIIAEVNGLAWALVQIFKLSFVGVKFGISRISSVMGGIRRIFAISI